MAHLKAQNALLPLYRKDLKKYCGFDWLESTELAIDKRKFLLNRLFVKQPIPQDEELTYFVCYIVFFALNTNVFQTNIFVMLEFISLLRGLQSCLVFSM